MTRFMYYFFVVFNFALLAVLTAIGIKHYVHGDSATFWSMVGAVVFLRMFFDTLASLFGLVKTDIDKFIEDAEKAEKDDKSDPPMPPTSAA